MLIVQFVILIIGSVTHASQNYGSDLENVVVEENPREMKETELLKNEILKLTKVNKEILENLEAINHKIFALDTKLHDKLLKLENKVDELGKKYHDFEEKREESLREKLGHQETIIVEKLKNYIKEKFDDLDRYIYLKTDVLDKIIERKTDSINRKLDKWKINESELNENSTTVNSNSKMFENVTLKQNDDIIKKINGIETKISELNNKTLVKFDELYKKINYLEVKLDLKGLVSKNMTHGMEEKIKKILDAPSNTTSKHTPKSTEAIRNQCKTWKVPTNMFYLYPFYHLKIDDKFGIANFEMRFAIKTAKSGIIKLIPRLTDMESPMQFVIQIGRNNNSQTTIAAHQYPGQTRWANLVNTVDTPNILSATQFTAFYLKIENGRLELSKKKGLLPFLTLSDERLKYVREFNFSDRPPDTEATYLYDCLPNFEESLN